MAVFRFRVQFEEYDDVSRDIEIKSSQNFKELHEAIQKAINFDNKHAASFFVSDAYWRKGLEITLLEEDLESGVKLMEKTKIASCVEDPHQRFVYIYDKQVAWSFNIELIKITKDESGNFPSCVKTVGVAPKQYKPAKTDKKDEVSSGEAGFAALLQDMDDGDDEAYKNAKEETEEILDEEEARGVIGSSETGEDDAEFEESEEGENEEDGSDEDGYDQYNEDER